MTKKTKPNHRAKPTKKQPKELPEGQGKRRHIATFEAVQRAYDVLRSANIPKPTVRQIRSAIGGGSHSTISKHLIRIRGRIYFRDEEFVIKMGTTRRPSTLTWHQSRSASTTRRSRTTCTIRTSRRTRTTRFADPTL